MAKPFREPKEGEVPTEGGEDELLSEIPDTPMEAGSLRAYKAGSRVRRWVFGSLLVGIVAAGFIGRWYVGYLEEQSKKLNFQYDESTLHERPRQMEWSEGPAKLPLAREPPAVQEIWLPDRVVRLADGHERAIVDVEVRDGKTVRVEALTGAVTQHRRPDTEAAAAEEPPTATPATAP